MKIVKIVLSILVIFLLLLALQYSIQSGESFRFILDEEEMMTTLTTLGATEVAISPESIVTLTVEQGKPPLDQMRGKVILYPGVLLDDIVEAPEGQTLQPTLSRNENGVLVFVFSDGMQQMLRTSAQEQLFSFQKAFQQIIMQLINGVTLGGVYAMIAVGYTLVYGIMFMINFAHGEIFMFGAYGAFYVCYWLTSAQDLRVPWLAAPLFIGIIALCIRVLLRSELAKSIKVFILGLYAFCFLLYLGLAFQIIPADATMLSQTLIWLFVLLLAFLFAITVSAGLGVVVEFTAYRPLRQAPRLTLLISAIGASIFLQNVMMIVTKGQIKYFPNEVLVQGGIDLTGGILLEKIGLLIIIVSIIMMAILYFIIGRTKTGKAIRAVAEDKATASLMGINVNQIVVTTFFLGSSMAGAGGILFGLRSTQINHMMGFLPGMKAFTAAVLGGIGNIPGAMFGGYFLGIAEALGAQFMPAEYKDVIAFTLLVLVLIFRPTGIMGEVLATKKM